MKKRNRAACNFGLRNRCMVRAGTNALREAGASFVTRAVNSSRWKMFCKYLGENYAISDMRNINKSHVESYAESLRIREKNLQLSTSTAQDYLAAVNRILETARGDRELRVTGVRDAGLNRRSHIATKSKSADETVHDNVCMSISPHLSAILKLQRTLGLRFEESLKINAFNALEQALRDNRIKITAGTKGGRTREIAIVSEKQIEALTDAIQYQSTRGSLIPDDLTYAQFKRQCYREIETFDLTFHGERHAFANARYLQLTGAKSPVESGKSGRGHIEDLAKITGLTVAEAMALDLDARLAIAEELGHSRTQITNNYLGK